jgi:hypothetical protein
VPQAIKTRSRHQSSEPADDLEYDNSRSTEASAEASAALEVVDEVLEEQATSSDQRATARMEEAADVGDEILRAIYDKDTEALRDLIVSARDRGEHFADAVRAYVALYMSCAC